MALDEAIFQLYLERGAPATLRLYGWSSPCLTVGYSQPTARDVDLARCRAEGVPVVRRPTGGRAILHDRETTFSLVGPAPKGSIAQPYEQVARGVIRALSGMGLEAELAGPKGKTGNGQRSGACFDSAFGHEVLVAGRKIAGIAQARRQESALCQGTLPLEIDAEHLYRLLRATSDEARDLAARQFEARVVSLSAALGRPVTWEEVATALARGFAQAVEADFAPGEPTPEENALAQQLLREKYTHPTWNMGR